MLTETQPKDILFLRSHEPLAQYLLDEAKPIDPDQLQKTLGVIWKIAYTLYPYGRTGPTELSVPSKRMVELGLVSVITDAKAAQGGRKRINLTDVNGDRDKIKIVREASDGDFVFVDTYINEEDIYHTRDGIIRRNVKVEEKTTLTRVVGDYGSETFVAEIHARKIPQSLDGLGGKWDAQIEKQEEFAETEVTPRRINTIFALLTEGLASGVLSR